MIEQHLPPAQLWIGSSQTLLAETMHYLQKTFCSNEACGICITCTQIRTQQHHAILWLQPEKQYTLDELAPLQERLAFALAPDEQFFFILERADLLSKQSANSLLKSIEEPPTGYRFILCAERLQNVISTIQSRCIIRSFSQEQFTLPHQELYDYFAAQPIERNISQQTLAFLNYLQTSNINEIESLELIDRLFAHWLKQYNQELAQAKLNIQTKKSVASLKQALLKPPMPGSAKLFWKHLYCDFYTP